MSSFNIGLRGMHVSFLKFRMMLKWRKYVENSSSHDRDFPFTVRNELRFMVLALISENKNETGAWARASCRWSNARAPLLTPPSSHAPNSHSPSLPLLQRLTYHAPPPPPPPPLSLSLSLCYTYLGSVKQTHHHHHHHPSPPSTPPPSPFPISFDLALPFIHHQFLFS